MDRLCMYRLCHIIHLLDLLTSILVSAHSFSQFTREKHLIVNVHLVKEFRVKGVSSIAHYPL